MSDVEGIEREKVVLEVELADHTAPCEWFFADQIIEPDERSVMTSSAWRSLGIREGNVYKFPGMHSNKKSVKSSLVEKYQ